MIKTLQRLPVATILRLVGIWVLLGLGNYLLIELGIQTGTPRSFPISVFYGPMFNPAWFPFAVGFVLLLFLLYRRGAQLGTLQVWGVALLFLLLGNVANGGFELGFHAPFQETTDQYYHDAIAISDPAEWLRTFNEQQPTLGAHTKTHPPFAVLLHYYLWKGTGLTGLTIFFTLLASAMIPLVRRIFLELGLEPGHASGLALLLALTPAFNIYAAVSLDGVIAAVSTLALLGLVMLLRRRRILVGGTLFLLGTVGMNLLSFGGTFLPAVAGLLAVRELRRREGYGVAGTLTATVAVLLLLFPGLDPAIGYDHVEAFFTASRIENPGGLYLLSAPVEYLMTRIENVAEIILFLSLGTAAVLVRRDYRGKPRQIAAVVGIAGTAVLFLMFLSGAFRTGETARACLFIYPYILLFLTDSDEDLLPALILTAGLQTIIMQTFAWYFW